MRIELECVCQECPTSGPEDRGATSENDELGRPSAARVVWREIEKHILIGKEE